MTVRSAAFALLLCCTAGAFADEPAAASSAAQHGSPSLDNANCAAYRDSMMAVRTPKDLGTVTLHVEVSAQGEVTNADVAEHTTTNYFAHVVAQNFARCHFRPARENDVPVAGQTTLRLAFGDAPRVPNNARCPSIATRERPPADGPMASAKLRVRFLKTGEVAAVDVLQPSGFPAFDGAAVRAYRQCRFDPGASEQPAFQEEWVTTLNWGG